MAELKNFVAQGVTSPDGKTNFIKIENLTLNINHAGSVQNYIQNEISSDLAIKGMKDILSNRDTEAARTMQGKAKDIGKR